MAVHCEETMEKRGFDEFISSFATASAIVYSDYFNWKLCVLIGILGRTWLKKNGPRSDKGTGSGWKKKGAAQFRIFNIGNTSPVPFAKGAEFGYKPTTDLQTRLKKFVRWYEKYYGSGKKSDH
ncbi:putative UDP-glucuronate 4-epimerase [Helianthus anomalus]